MSIPKKIHQTFEYKNFSLDLQEVVNEWLIENPLFSHKVYDKTEREEFIKENFLPEVYDAYKRIKPGAFKADLWRYCILYKFGGFYADLDTLCIGSLEEFIKDSIDFVAPVDIVDSNHGPYIVSNGFMGCTPNHPIVMDCIERILKWIKLETLPNSIYDFSGPGCLGKSVNHYLGRKEDESLIGCEGIYQKIMLIHFEEKHEYMRDLNNKKILQNKNGNSHIKNVYDAECKKIKNYFNWGEYGHNNVPFNKIIEIIPSPHFNKQKTNKQISAYLWGYKNYKAGSKCIETFKKFYLDSDVFIRVDTDGDYDNYKKSTNRFNIDIDFQKKKIGYPGNYLEHSVGRDHWPYENLHTWLTSIYNCCKQTLSKYMIILEEDTFLMKPISIINNEFGVAIAINNNPIPTRLTQFIMSVGGNTKSNGYGGCGGAIINTQDFIKGYDIAIKKLEIEFDDISKDTKLVGWSDMMLQLIIMCGGGKVIVNQQLVVPEWKEDWLISGSWENHEMVTCLKDITLLP